MENAFIVRGGKPLIGQVELSGAKNVALKVLVASLMFKTKVTFTNIPEIEDIKELLHLFALLGVGVKQENDRVEIDPSTLSGHKVDMLHGSKIRASFMLFAPLLYRFGVAVIPNPGGCRLGARPIDRHISCLKSFGVEVTYDSDNGFYTATLPTGKLTAGNYTFEKKTHTGTELAILMAVLAVGESQIHNVAHEPEVDDLIKFLNQSGAKVKRQGGSIIVMGVDELISPSDPYHIMYDEIEAATYGVLALATKGDILIKNTSGQNLKDFIQMVEETGGGVEIQNDGIRFFYKGTLKPTNITTTPYPGFRTDWQPLWALLMTQAEGESTIHETLFENKFGYVEELRKVGAKIDFYKPDISNPHEIYQFTVTSEIMDNLLQAVKVSGPTQLHNGVLVVKDIRAGATVLIAACMASGESVVQGVSTIDRGYERIEMKLSALGADIRRV